MKTQAELVCHFPPPKYIKQHLGSDFLRWGISSEIPTLGMSNQKIEPHISWDFLKYSAHPFQKSEFIRQTGKPLPNRLFDNRGISNAVST